MNACEDTFLNMKFTLNCWGTVVDLSTPVVMGIVNLTPDSFFDGGTLSSDKDLLDRVAFQLKNGAKIVDIGGQSTRLGAEIIQADDEWERIRKAIAIILKEFPETVLSIDTFYSSVAKKAADLGAGIINDISGGSMDPEMFSTMAQLKLPYVLMHIPGTPQTMHQIPEYRNIINEVSDYFDKKISVLKSHGVEQIILDPGFGFGKTVDQNYLLLKNLSAFHHFHLPILAGLSRKSMINKVLQIRADKALNGTTVLNTIALLNNASILRVHDVIEAREVITLVEQYRNVG